MYVLKLDFVIVQPYGAKYSRLMDGRRICSDCQSSAIDDLHECRPLIEEIQRFYEGLDMKVYEQFPFEVVGLEEMSVSANVFFLFNLFTLITLTVLFFMHVHHALFSAKI